MRNEEWGEESGTSPLTLRRWHFGREVAFGQLDALAVLGGRNQGRQLGQDTEHQEFAYGSQDAAIDDAHWRKQEASYDKQEANCKINDNANDNFY